MLFVEMVLSSLFLWLLVGPFFGGFLIWIIQLTLIILPFLALKLFGGWRAVIAEVEKCQHKKQERRNMLSWGIFQCWKDGFSDKHQVEEDLTIEEGKPVWQERHYFWRIREVSEEGTAAENRKESLFSSWYLIPDML